MLVLRPTVTSKPLALHGHDADARGQAAYILSIKHEWERLEAFVCSRETIQSFLRAMALRMVGKLGDEQLVKLAVSHIQDDDPKVRLAVVRALCDLGARVPDEARSVGVLLRDEDLWIRRAALGSGSI